MSATSKEWTISILLQDLSLQHDVETVFTSLLGGTIRALPQLASGEPDAHLKYVATGRPRP